MSVSEELPGPSEEQHSPQEESEASDEYSDDSEFEAASTPDSKLNSSSQPPTPDQFRVIQIDRERQRRYSNDEPTRTKPLKSKPTKAAAEPEGRVCAMLNRDIAELEGFGFVDQFFYQLWRTEPGMQRFCEPHLAIPHTVLFNCGQPTKWFFTSKQTASYGEFQKKKRKNSTSPNIYAEFLKQRKNKSSDVIASYISGKHFKPGEHSRPQVEFLDAKGFKEFMSPSRQMKMAENEELGFLQVFVEPKNNFLTHGRRNFVLRVKWTPHICLVSARVNCFELDPVKKSAGSKHSIFERAATFEGNSDGSNGAIVSDRLGQFLKQMCTKIVRHLELRSPAVELMELNFKIDDHNTVWLLCCSSLQFHTGGKISRVLLSPEMQQASHQAKHTQRSFTRCCVCAHCGTTFSDNVKCAVSFKSALLHHMALEAARAQRVLNSQDPLAEPQGELSLQAQLQQLGALGCPFSVPVTLKSADPRLTAATLLRAIEKNDMHTLYRLADVCSGCAHKILEYQSTASFTGVSASMLSQLAHGGPEDTDKERLPGRRRKHINFVGVNAKLGGTTDVTRAHFAFEDTEALQDIRDTTLDALLATTKRRIVASPRTAPEQPKPPPPSLTPRHRSPSPYVAPWCPSAAYPQPPAQTRTPRVSSAALRRQQRGVVLPSTRDFKTLVRNPGEEPATARELQQSLPSIECSGFRPPKLPLTSRRPRPKPKQSTSPVAQMAQQVFDYSEPNLMDHASEAARLEGQAAEMLLEAKLHRAAAQSQQPS